MSKVFVNRLQVVLFKLHNHPWFEWTTVSIILISSLNIGAKSYDLPHYFKILIGVLDWLVTIYFLIEIIIRLLATNRLRNFFQSRWNCFDFAIVFFSLIPINESEYALLARLLRLFRVMRLIFFIPQLRILIGALLVAIPRIGYVTLMMFVIFYIYGAVGNLLFEKINPYLWGDIGVSMLTLFRVATFEDWTDVMYETMAVHSFSWIYYLTFIFLSTFVFLNMMIGVIINVFEEQNQNKQTALHNEQLQTIQNQLSRLEQQLNVIETKTSHHYNNQPSNPR